MVEREMSKPPLRASEVGFEQQARSPLDQARHEFLAEALEQGIDNNRPKGAKPRKVEQRENVILGRYKAGETFESVGRDYGMPESWATKQFEEGLKRVWNSSPQELRKKYPKETLFMTAKEKRRATLQKRRTGTALRSIEESVLADQLADPNLSKDQLKRLVPKVNRGFYQKNKGLFVRLERIVRLSGRLSSSRNLTSFAKEVEQRGGVVVFSYAEKTRKGEDLTRFLVLSLDADAAVDTLKPPNNTQNLPRQSVEGQQIYRSFD